MKWTEAKRRRTVEWRSSMWQAERWGERSWCLTSSSEASLDPSKIASSDSPSTTYKITSFGHRRQQPIRGLGLLCFAIIEPPDFAGNRLLWFCRRRLSNTHRRLGMGFTKITRLNSPGSMGLGILGMGFKKKMKKKQK